VRKYQIMDTEIINARNKFFERCDLSPKFTADNFPLFAGKVPLASFLAKSELVKMTQNIPGHICEFGVFNGSGLLSLAKLLDLYGTNNLKEVYGFDSFEGLTEINPEMDRDQEVGRYKGNLSCLLEMIKIHNLSDRVNLVQGYIEKSLPNFLNENNHKLFSLIYIDTDLYDSTKVILESLWPQISTGGIVALDEGYHDEFPGEGIAALEFINKDNIKYSMHSFPYARQPMYYIKKLC